MRQRQAPNQALQLGDAPGILDTGWVWTFDHGGGSRQQAALPIGQYGGCELVRSAALGTARRPRPQLQHDLSVARGGELATVCHMTLPLWTSCTVV